MAGDQIFNLEKTKERILEIYKKTGEILIIAHGDWDGVVGAGLLKRWIKNHLDLDVQLTFPFKELATMNLDKVITIETTNFAESTKNSIVIDHHIQGKSIDPSNVEIIDNQNYDKSSVATLIADVFNIELNKEFLMAIDAIDNGKVNLVKYILEHLSSNHNNMTDEINQILHNASDEIKLYAAFRADVPGFPRERIAHWISEKDFQSIKGWTTEKCLIFADVMPSIIKILKENVIKIPGFDAVIVTGVNGNIDPLESNALKPAALYLEETYKVVFALLLNDKGSIISGTIGTLDEKLNFDKANLYKKIEQIPKIRSAGGRSNVGGFQVEEGEAISLKMFKTKINVILKDIFT